MGHGKDPTLRHFVYYLTDANGEVVYVGRSRNVALRIQTHHHQAVTQCETTGNNKAWIFDVRSVSMGGPMSWERSIETERAAIERIQPRGNIKLTKRDIWRRENREQVSA
jgi:predicted GIY-YIG superfamily endonuclease